MDTTTRSCSVALGQTSLVAAAGGHLATGALGEELAAGHLQQRHGLTIVARNWRLATGELRGELDLVALDAGSRELIVCEVKTRRNAGRFGGAVAAVSPRKRAQVRRLTAAYLREGATQHRQVRLDVIAVDLGEVATLTHLAAAL